MLKARRITFAYLGICFFACGLSHAQIRGSLQPVTCARATVDSRIEVLESGHSAIYFCPPNDVTKWNVFWLPTHLHFSEMVGGCKEGLLVLVSLDADETGDPGQANSTLQLLTFDGNIKAMAPGGVVAHCEFFDDKIGCQVKEQKLLVTVDGGHKWRKMPIDLSTAGGPLSEDDIVTGLKWLSSSELLVGKRGGDVSLLKVDDGGGKVQWTVNVGSSPSSFSAEGDDAVWLWTAASDIVLLSRKDGHEITRVKTGIANSTGLWLAADSNHLYVWGGQNPEGKTPEEFIKATTQATGSIISIWNWNGSALTPQQTLITQHVASVVPLNDKIVVFYYDGKVSTLEGTTLVPQKVSISEIGQFPGQPDINGINPTPLPRPSHPTKPLPADYLPTRDQQMEYVMALRSVSASDVDAVLQELSGREDLTPRQ